MDSLRVYALIQELSRQDIPHVLISLVDVHSSAPQDVGAKMVVTAEGLRGGTVGGGKVEAFVIRQAQEMLDTDKTTR